MGIRSEVAFNIEGNDLALLKKFVEDSPELFELNEITKYIRQINFNLFSLRFYATWIKWNDNILETEQFYKIWDKTDEEELNAKCIEICHDYSNLEDSILIIGCGTDWPTYTLQIDPPEDL